ncbi:amino acid ABC transporter permease [Saccharospirillum salsuginis]|uniref:Amino acid ABC transporter permease n=1 Tax=Saccharospirillum salsuginis TaxID=418750 RepID=A0A918K177_9GAMM|nr:amino acid ABC transporter permease [Saccharospirillum salsuginis]GGX41225.1 amino acid ABC transporter permease [Saccharospirillum salsuginis]
MTNLIPNQNRPTTGSATHRSWRWVRENLFSTPLNSVITIFCLYIIWQVLSTVVGWALINASFASTKDACEAVSGACWAYVHQNYRFVLFGTYPLDEQWRSVLGSVMLIVGMLVSMNRRFWSPWLALAWLVWLALLYIILAGDVFGLTRVDSAQWGGLTLTLLLAVVGIGFAAPLALLLALGRRSEMPFVKVVCVVFIEVFRGVPLISVLIMASVMFPLFLPEGVTINKLLRAQVGIIFFQAAYLAEVFRGGMQAIPSGQYEAADSLGLGYWQKMGKIILPQALRLVIPPTMSTFISLLKDTSLVVIIGLFDLLGATKSAINDPAWRQQFIEGYVFIALIFFCFCFFMSRYSLHLDRELKRGM